MKFKKIYALVGMAGSGKSEAINYLQGKFSWPKIYMGAPTFERIEKEGLELNYENEKIIRERYRQELGMGAYALLALPKLKELLSNNDIVLLESMYSWDEYKIIKNEYGDAFKVIAIYASPATRLARLAQRKNWRPIEAAEELRQRDWTEIEGTDKGGPIAIADYTVVNEGGVDELHGKIDAIFD